MGGKRKFCLDVCHCRDFSSSWLPATSRRKLPFFECEDIATADNLKIFGDEFGCIFPEQGKLRIRTEKRDHLISHNNLSMNTHRPKGKAEGVLLKWSGVNPGDSYEGVAHFKYIGTDMQIAADKEKKSEWAQSIIRSWMKN